MERESVSIWCWLQALVKSGMARGCWDAKHAKTEVLLILEVKPGERWRGVHVVVGARLVWNDTAKGGLWESEQLNSFGRQRERDLIYNTITNDRGSRG